MGWKRLQAVVRKRLPVVVLIGIMAPAALAADQVTTADVLAGLSGKAIQPALDRAVSTTRDLAGAAQVLCGRKDEAALEKARQAWVEAYLAWRTAQPMMLQGKRCRSEQVVDNWPANEVVLKGATEANDLAYLLKTSEVRGFPGAEYLLFAVANAAEAATAGRCGHLRSVTDELVAQAEHNRQLWEEDAASFVAAGDGKPYLIAEDALSPVFARILNVTERLLRDRLCAPCGFFEGSARPALLESWRSDSTRKAFRATLAGIRQVLIGDGKDGIVALVAVKDGLLSKKNPGLAEDIRKQFDLVDAQLDKLDDGILIHEKLQKNGKILHRLYRTIEKLQELIVEASLNLEVDVIGPGEV